MNPSSVPTPTFSADEALEHVIIGGGICGVHLAVRLLAEAGVAPRRLVIVDPAPALLHRWDTCTANTGMPFLRSPAVHHLDLDPWSLLRFAGVRGRQRRQPDQFTPPYDRPAIDLFAEHSRWTIAQHGLSDRHLAARATAVRLTDAGASVTLADGTELSTARVVLALGASEQPHWPDWARALREAGGHVEHVFQPGFDLQPDALPARVIVMGAGITGAQVALRLARAGRQVTLVARHELREHQFDSDPGWLGPKEMTRFQAERSATARRRLIQQARHRGSLPKDVLRELRAAMRRGEVVWHRAEVQGAAVTDDGLTLTTSAGARAADALILATGFDRHRPGGALVDQLVADHHLPCAACGYPLVDPYLRWHPRLYVSGPLAELELGPTSRNIAGARRAGERIVAAMSA
jgi:cation diffusion facilitator CzcD-associated flavoprotein CzcO